MAKEQRITVGSLYVIAGLIFALTAWFSAGYNHFDEHFQVLEFAGLKLGLTVKANLPWEHACMMRPALQPLTVFSVYKTMAAAGITNPFTIAFIIRLLSALLTFASIHLVIRLYAPEFTNRRLLFSFLILSFFLWFIPYNGARFSSETISGRVFLIGLAWFFLRKELKPVHYLLTGIVLGTAFVTRYQVAFMVIGFAAWLAVIQKAGSRNLLLFTGGIIAAAASGVLIDRWYYGEWVLTAWKYFQQNILLDKAAGFGTSPWWYYISQTFINAFPPLSLVYILAVFLYILYYPRDIVTWTVVPFLAVHFLIPHKEIRFLFPVIGLLPVMIARTADTLLKKKSYHLLEHRAVAVSVKLFWYLNMVMLIVLIFRPADDGIALYKKLWDDYRTPAKLFYTDDNPYHRAKVDIHFYKRNSLILQHVDSLQGISLSEDTASLYVTDRPLLPNSLRFDPVLIYATFPQWVRRFNVNNWIERTSFWYVYELKPGQTVNKHP